jgi:murein DD-endopeptidase MepM/ murein hydrolase activator NlpD
MKHHSLVFALAAAALADGCGGTEPLSAITSPAPQLSLPVLETAVNTVQKFSQATATLNYGIDISVIPVGQNVIAPAGGIISSVDNTLGAAVVYVYHSPHLTTRISQLQTLSVQAGAIAQTGSVLGLSSNTGAPVHFRVYYDGVIVCPQSYFTASAQALLVAHASAGAGATLCD